MPRRRLGRARELGHRLVGAAARRVGVAALAVERVALPLRRVAVPCRRGDRVRCRREG